jgi:hypothetical protein
MLPGLHGSLAEGDRLSLLQTQCSRRTDAQAETGAVAQLLLQHPGLAIHQLNRPFAAGNHTQPAAGAQFLIYAHYLTCSHGNLHPLCPIQKDDLEPT